jgi:hypothetical protein
MNEGRPTLSRQKNLQRTNFSVRMSVNQNMISKKHTIFAVRVSPPVPASIGIVWSVADHSLRIQDDDVVHLGNFVVPRVAHENVVDFASETISREKN